MMLSVCAAGCDRSGGSTTPPATPAASANSPAPGVTQIAAAPGAPAGGDAATAIAGKMDLMLERPFQTEHCCGVWLRSGGGRQTIFQITSYRDPAAEKFPSVFLRCAVDQKRLSDLDGKKINVDRAFVQESSDGSIWELPSKETGSLTLERASDLEFRGTLAVKLVNVETGQERDLTGNISGEIVP